jgi:hypothetical protein
MGRGMSLPVLVFGMRVDDGTMAEAKDPSPRRRPGLRGSTQRRRQCPRPGPYCGLGSCITVSAVPEHDADVEPCSTVAASRSGLLQLREDGSEVAAEGLDGPQLVPVLLAPCSPSLPHPVDGDRGVRITEALIADEGSDR